MVTHALLRSLAVFGGIALVWKFTDINLLSLVVGILGLKTGAYLYPVVRRIADRRTGSGRHDEKRQRIIKRKEGERMGGGSEADFMIHGIMKYHLFGQELWITTTTVGMTIITIVLPILAFAANRAMKHATEVPGTFQNILELGVEMLEKMTQGILGPSARRFANYIGTIFLFILFCNLSGLFGLRTVTADFGVTFLLGLVTFAIVQYQGIKKPWSRSLHRFV